MVSHGDVPLPDVAGPPIGFFGCMSKPHPRRGEPSSHPRCDSPGPGSPALRLLVAPAVKPDAGRGEQSSHPGVICSALPGEAITGPGTGRHGPFGRIDVLNSPNGRYCLSRACSRSARAALIIAGDHIDHALTAHPAGAKARGEDPAGQEGVAMQVPMTGAAVLTGPLCDRAALYGVLAQIEARGLELLEVRRLPPAGQPAPEERRSSCQLEHRTPGLPPASPGCGHRPAAEAAGPGAGRHRDGPADGRARPDHRQRRPAAYPGRTALLRVEPGMGRQRLRGGVRRPAAAGRPGRRPARTPPDLHRRAAGLRATLAARRVRHRPG